MLFQNQGGEKKAQKLLAYASLRPLERNIKLCLKLELLGLKWSMVEQFITYLVGARVEVYTGNTNLAFWEKAMLGAIDQRWITELAMFKYDIKHKPGRKKNVDYFSRYLYKYPVVADDDGDVVISQNRVTPVPPELTVLDVTKRVRVGATSVSVEVLVLADTALVTTLPAHSTQELLRLH